MASSSEIVPHEPIYESDGSDNDLALTQEPRAASPKGKGEKCAPPTITAIRIAADGTVPHRITLQLIEATKEYHLSLHDYNILHHPKADAMRHVHRHSNPLADDGQLDIEQVDVSRSNTEENANWPPDLIDPDLLLNDSPYGNGNGTLLDVSLTK